MNGRAVDLRVQRHFSVGAQESVEEEATHVGRVNRNQIEGHFVILHKGPGSPFGEGLRSEVPVHDRRILALFLDEVRRDCVPLGFDGAEAACFGSDAGGDGRCDYDTLDGGTNEGNFFRRSW